MAAKKRGTRVLKGQEAFFFHKPAKPAKKPSARKGTKSRVKSPMKRPRKVRVKSQPALGEYKKAKGMNDAERGADPAWRVRAARAIIKVAQEKEFFTSDDVWLTGLDKPREPRALGPEMKSAQLVGIIAATNDLKLTVQASRHRAPVRRWRSCIFKSKGPATIAMLAAQLPAIREAREHAKAKKKRKSYAKVTKVRNTKP